MHNPQVIAACQGLAGRDQSRMIQSHRYRITGGDIFTAGGNRQFFAVGIIAVPAWTHPVVIDNIKGRVRFLIIVLRGDPVVRTGHLGDSDLVNPSVPGFCAPYTITAEPEICGSHSNRPLISIWGLIIGHFGSIII